VIDSEGAGTLAIAIDRAWNIILSNAPFDRLSAMIGADLWSRVGGGRRTSPPTNIECLFPADEATERLFRDNRA